jgi:hypothetical protein
MSETTSPFAPLAGAEFLVLTTYRTSGVGVPTTVWFAEANGKLYITTNAGAGKAKRIRHTPAVTLAPSDARGATSAPAFAARAQLLPKAEFGVAEAALHAKYGAQFDAVLAQAAAHRSADVASQRIYIEIAPAE